MYRIRYCLLFFFVSISVLTLGCGQGNTANSAPKISNPGSNDTLTGGLKGSWSKPIALSMQDLGENVQRLEFATNDSGIGFALWNDSKRVLASKYTKENGWQEAETIFTSNTNEPTTNPYIFVAENGDATAIWDGVRVSRYDSDTEEWSVAEQICTPSTGCHESFTEHQPVISINHQGDLVAAWYGSSNSVSQASVYANHTENGTWQEAQLIQEQEPSQLEYRIKISSNSSGQTLVIWWENTGSGQAYYTYYDTIGGWHSRDFVDRYLTARKRKQTLIPLKNDRFLFVGNMVSEALSATFDTTNLWQFDPENEFGFQGFSAPIVTTNSLSEILAVSHGTDQCGMYAFQNKSTYFIDKPVKIGQGPIRCDASSIRSEDIATNTVGNGIAVWRFADNTVQANTYDASKNWGPVYDENSNEPIGDTAWSLPSIVVELKNPTHADKGIHTALDPNNSGMLLWVGEDGGGTAQVYVSLFK